MLAIGHALSSSGLNSGEWTLERARKEWKPMVRPVMHVGVPGFEFQTGVMWDGSLVFGPLDFLGLKVMQEEMKLHNASPMHVSFGFGEKMRLVDRQGIANPLIQRSLFAYSFPSPTFRIREDPFVWDESVEAYLLSRKTGPGDSIIDEDAMVTDVQFMATNGGSKKETAHLWIHFGDTSKVHFGYKARQDPELAPAISHRFEPPLGLVGNDVRYVLYRSGAGQIVWHDSVDEVEGASGKADRVLEWRVEVEPYKTAYLHLAILYGLFPREYVDEILEVDSHHAHEQFWQMWNWKFHSPGAIETGDEWITSYLDAIPSTMAQQVAYRKSTDTWMYKTSPNHYEGYWPCNAAKALPTFDYRGLTKLNEKVLAGFVKNQTDDVGGLDKRGMGHGEELKGEGYAKVDGFLGNFGEWTANPLLISHGLGMWALAQHYRITRDEKWLKTPIGNPLGKRSPLEAMLKAFDWVSTQRRRTMTKPLLPPDRKSKIQNPKSAYWGLLPPASAHDWLAGSTIFNDAWCIYGMAEVVRLCREIHDSRTDAMAKELADYRKCLHDRYAEATAKSEKVRMPDGSEIPFVPRMVDELDWRKIDWTYTGYGPLRAGAMGALDPHDRLVDLSLRFLEEGMPKGEGPYFSAHKQYPDTADANWADISDPEAPRHWLWRHYVEYETMWPVGGQLFLARDDLPRFFEWLFNNLAVAVHKDWKVGVESLDGVPSCAPGDGERWQLIRRMFVNETGGWDGSEQSLFLLQAIPREWLRPGKKLAVSDMGTAFGGKLNLKIEVDKGGSVSVELNAKGLVSLPSNVRMRLRSGSGKPLRAATLNGKPLKVLPGECIELPRKLEGRYRVAAFF